MEKFLEYASSENHNDYCLAYVFTQRDFDNGVLGLAWVGSARKLWSFQNRINTTITCLEAIIKNVFVQEVLVAYVINTDNMMENPVRV